MMKEEQARKEIGIQASMDLNLGLQNYAVEFSPAFGNQGLFSVSGVTMKIPIIGHKTARDKYKAAQFETRSVEAESMENIRKLRVEVDCAVRDFENYRMLIISAEETMSLADNTYRQIQENYANGIADINSFAIAQTRKENAYTNYLNALCYYWDAFYRLSMLCGTDLYSIIGKDSEIE